MNKLWVFIAAASLIGVIEIAAAGANAVLALKPAVPAEGGTATVHPVQFTFGGGGYGRGGFHLYGLRGREQRRQSRSRFDRYDRQRRQSNRTRYPGNNRMTKYPTHNRYQSRVEKNKDRVKITDRWKHRRYGSRVVGKDPYRERWKHRRFGSRVVINPPVIASGPAYVPPQQQFLAPPLRSVSPPPRPPRFAAPPVPPAPALPSPSPSAVQTLLENKKYREREILVTVSSNAPAELRQDLANSYGSEVREIGVIQLLGTRLLHLTLPEGQSVQAVLPALFQDVRILSAQPNYVYDAAQANKTQQPAPLYSLAALQIPDTGNFPSGNGVKVAVIDTCVDTTHTELQGAIEQFFDAMPTRAEYCEGEDHGTAIAGLIGARADVRGVASSAALITARAFGLNPESGQVEGTTEAIIRALDWAVREKAHIANMSFAGPRDPFIEKVIVAAYRRGTILIAAAGNAGPNSAPLYPAAYPEVIAVTAIDASEQLYTAANTGPHISVSAPGVDVIVARPNGAYDVDSGTSLAAATISGVTAALLEKRPKARPEQIRAALQSTAVNRSGSQNKDNFFGFGLVDAKAATSFVEANVAQ